MEATINELQQCIKDKNWDRAIECCTTLESYIWIELLMNNNPAKMYDHCPLSKEDQEKLYWMTKDK